MLKYSDSLAHPEVFTDAAKSGRMNSGEASGASSTGDNSPRVPHSPRAGSTQHSRHNSESSQTGIYYMSLLCIPVSCKTLKTFTTI